MINARRESSKSRLQKKSDYVYAKIKEKEDLKIQRTTAQLEFYRSSSSKNASIEKAYTAEMMGNVGSAKGKLIVRVLSIYGDRDFLSESDVVKSDLVAAIRDCDVGDSLFGSLSILSAMLESDPTENTLQNCIKMVIKKDALKNQGGQNDGGQGGLGDEQGMVIQGGINDMLQDGVVDDGVNEQNGMGLEWQDFGNEDQDGNHNHNNNRRGKE